jgi:hypothetical protein
VTVHGRPGPPTKVVQKREAAEWDERYGKLTDLSAFQREILPLIQHVPLSRLQRATGLSLRYVGQIAKHVTQALRDQIPDGVIETALRRLVDEQLPPQAFDRLIDELFTADARAAPRPEPLGDDRGRAKDETAEYERHQLHRDDAHAATASDDDSLS